MPKVEPGAENLFSYSLIETWGCYAPPAGIKIKFNHFTNRREMIKNKAYANYQTVVEILPRYFNPNELDIDKRNYITKTIRNRSISQFPCLSELVKLKKLNVNASDRYGWTPLHYAVISSDYESIKLLISIGADPNIKTKDVPSEHKTVITEHGHPFYPRPNATAKDLANSCLMYPNRVFN